MEVKHTLATLVGKLLKPIHAGDEKLAARKEGVAPTEIRVESPSLKPGGVVPAPHVGDHGRSPALRWSGVPSSTREVVVLCEDPDAPLPKPYVHWLVYGIPPSATELDEGLPPSELPLANGVLQGKNSSGRYGYVGPKPPPGHGPHHYHFQVFALDERLDLEAPVERDALVEAMQGHVVGAGEIVGVYENR